MGEGGPRGGVGRGGQGEWCLRVGGEGGWGKCGQSGEEGIGGRGGFPEVDVHQSGGQEPGEQGWGGG